MMSALYLRGLKQGDVQMTASGVVTAGLFFFLSQAKPMVQLSPQRPPSSVFRASVAASIAGQFTVHLLSLIATLALCERHMAADDHTMTADGKFQPNVVNSAVYLLSAVMQVNNFVVNYRGHPFTQSIQENTLLWRSVQGIYASLLIVAGGQLPPLNDFLQLAPFPSSNFQAILIAILVLNFGVSFAIEKACQRFLE
jgi:cation-transporting ATPase 13A1